jgi:DNA polymerase-4
MTSCRDILHVDMDAFFAAVEQRDHPEYRGKPVVVGAGPQERGVVSTCSYEARPFGVHSAMPSREAYRLCPQAVFLPPDMPRYHAASRQVFAIFERFTPLVEPVSVDEAFLDVTGSRRLFGEPEAIAATIRAAIREETGGLTASVGLAGNKFLAKLATDLRKPDGFTAVPRDRAGILAFLAPLPVGRLWGVGKVLCELLQNHGYRTIGDIQRASESALAPVVGQHAAGHLLRLAFGEDEREIETEFEEKSISREYTFPTDCRDPEKLRHVLRDLADDVGRRVREANRFAATGRLKLRWADFQTLTRQRSFPAPARDDYTFRRLALELFEAEPLVQPVRLIGFGVSGFAAERQQQLTLFDDPVPRRDRNEKLCQTVDRLREKLGEEHLVRGDAVKKERHRG